MNLDFPMHNSLVNGGDGVDIAQLGLRFEKRAKAGERIVARISE